MSPLAVPGRLPDGAQWPFLWGATELRKRRAILHIGTEKTGTTSIQRSLAANRDLLVAQGFAYPVSPGSRNHLRLAIAAGNAGGNRALTRRALEPGGPEAVLASFPQRLQRELAALPDTVHTVIFSNEHCHSRLRTSQSVQRLHDILVPFFERMEVVVYLRRQDELAVSLYSTQLRGEAFVRRQILPEPERMWDYFDYAGMLDRYAAAFGKESLRPRLFDRSAMVGGDVVQDFLSICGLSRVNVPQRMAESNQSMRPEAQEFFRRLNEFALSLDARPDETWVKRRPIQRLMRAAYAGPGRLPARRDARAFLAAFEAGNERVRAEHFPERERLFNDNFSRYPEEEDNAAISDGRVLGVALWVVHALNEEARRERGNLLNLTGRLQVEAGQLDYARRSFMAALKEVPDHGRALQALARLVVDEESADLVRAHLQRARQVQPEHPLWAEIEQLIESWPDRAPGHSEVGGIRPVFPSDELGAVVAETLADPDDEAGDDAHHGAVRSRRADRRESDALAERLQVEAKGRPESPPTRRRRPPEAMPGGGSSAAIETAPVSAEERRRRREERRLARAARRRDAFSRRGV